MGPVIEAAGTISKGPGGSGSAPNWADMTLMMVVMVVTTPWLTVIRHCTPWIMDPVICALPAFSHSPASVLPAELSVVVK